MKKIIIILLLTTMANTAKSQFAATILQTLDTSYCQMGRLGTSNYIAALRQNALDIREAASGTFGVRKQTVVINAPMLWDARMEIAGNYIYVLSYDITPVEVSNPLSPISGTSIALQEKAIGSSHWGNFIYISTNNSKTYIYSIANPAMPALVDSITFLMNDMKISHNKLYTTYQSSQKIYSWNLSSTLPYLTLSDSIQMPVSSLLYMDVNGNQLIAKSTDTLYRFRINTVPDIIPMSSEAMPAYPYNGSLIARDTNIIAYSRYNSLYISSGIVGNSFIDSARVNVDGNYTINSMLLDNNLFYSNTAHSYLVGFAGSISGISNDKIDADVYIYPNPATSMLTISMEKSKIQQLRIYTVLGEEITTITPNNNQSIINVNQYAKGVYFIQITDEMKNTCTKKIVIQ
jgi:hypothetical protein